MSEKANRKLILEIIRESLEKLNPYNAVLSALEFDAEAGSLTISGEAIPMDENREVWILGGGKAAAAMGLGVEKVLGERIRDGILITPGVAGKPGNSGTSSGSGKPGNSRTSGGSGEKLNRIQLMEGSHPLPDKKSLSATLELVNLADNIPAGDVVICLISGGTSSLMCLPAGDLEPEDLALTYRHLLRSGADIHQMNVVRTALSGLKGGGLLSRLSHTTVIDLIISDVPGDDFKTIGSGPTTPQEVDYKKAHQILHEFDLWRNIPETVQQYISDCLVRPPERDRSLPEQHHQFLISSAGKLAGEVAKACRDKGYETEVAESAYSMPITDLVTNIREKISRLEREPDTPAGSRAFILYGESSVTVTGDGKGGRNQELALRVARHLTAGGNITFASIGTDGVDGPTDAAGAVVDSDTLSNARDNGIDPEIYLSNNDSYHFFKEVGGLIITGPTGNNLMDLQIILKN